MSATQMKKKVWRHTFEITTTLIIHIIYEKMNISVPNRSGQWASYLTL